MNTEFSRPTARIYQFPVRGHGATDRRRDEAKSVTSSSTNKASQAVYSGAWYHQAAIQDGERGRKD